MIEQDKFRRPIYPSIFRRLKENEKVLLVNGYGESKTKPNLFYKKIPDGCFFADMRGTEEVPIQKDTSPLLYFNFTETIPGWKRRRLVAEEFKHLFDAGCPCRFSFHLDDAPEFVGVSFVLDEGSGSLYSQDGYCRFCGRDFGGEGEFCSNECEEKYMDELKTPCQACGKKIEFGGEIRHHVSYFPERTILVHRSCHTRIHRSNVFSSLRPSEADVEKFYSGGKIRPAKHGLDNYTGFESQ